MNNPAAQDPVEVNAEKDAAFVKRLEELMAEMIQNGFVEYREQHTGEMMELTFHTVISEGIEDAEGFIPAMLQFYKPWSNLPGNRLLKPIDVALDFSHEIEKLLITYIEGDVMASEKGD